MAKTFVSKIDRQTWVKFFAHLIVITMLFILPDLMFSYARPHWRQASLYAVYIKPAIYVAVFYIDYYFILGRTLLRPKRAVWQFVGWNLLLMVCAVALIWMVQCMVYADAAPRKHHDVEGWVAALRMGSVLLRDMGMIILTIGLATALKLSENWDKIEKRHQELQAAQKAEELESLKSQLNPHFLFNTLNTIYALIAISPEQAQDAVHQLSKLLRYVLYENPERVRLSQEIQFASSYVSLMEMRLGDGAVKVHFDAGPDPEVEPLMFITLIENAFKHGNTGAPDQPIEISITSDPDGVITCSTSNHFVHGANTARHGGGIGIANLRRRLHLLYGDAASLSTCVRGDVYSAVLTIKTRTRQ